MKQRDSSHWWHGRQLTELHWVPLLCCLRRTLPSGPLPLCATPERLTPRRPAWNRSTFLTFFQTLFVYLISQLQLTFSSIWYWLQVYSIVVRHSYTLQTVPSDVSCTHLALCILVAMLLTTFPVLYFASLWLCCNCHFVFLNASTFVIRPHNPSPLTAVSPFSVFMSLFLFCLFCSLDSTYQWDHMVFVFLGLAYFT